MPRQISYVPTSMPPILILVWWACYLSAVPVVIAYLCNYITLRGIEIYILTFLGLTCFTFLYHYISITTET